MGSTKRNKPIIGGIAPNRDGTYPYINDITATNDSLRAWAARTGKHDLLVIDRPWAYGKKKGNAAHTAGAELEYPCITDEALIDLDVRAVTQPHAIVAEWVPLSLVPFLLKIWEAQKIAPVMPITWAKIGSQGGLLGCQSTGPVWPSAEVLYIGRRGNGLTPPNGRKRLDAVHCLPRGRHSEKPQAIHDLLAELYHGVARSRGELFCRTPKPGWHVWGNQSDGAHAAHAAAARKAVRS